MAGAPHTKLLALARSRFGDRLRAADLRVIEDAALARPTDLGGGDPQSSDMLWHERWVTADVLRWLLTDGDVRPLLSTRGVMIVGARVDDDLVLNGARLEVRLLLRACFLGAVMLNDARTESLSLNGSRCERLEAQRLRVRGSLFLDEEANGEERFPFTCGGGIDLTAAKIEGQLICRNASVAAGTGGRTALELERADVAGDLMLAGLVARGALGLVGATVGGSLNLAGASLTPSDGAAIRGHRLKVAHSLFLTHKFSADGGVLLCDAGIGHHVWVGRVDLAQPERLDDPKHTGATFTGVLDATRIAVAGNVHVRGPGVRLAGKVVLSDAKITGKLELSELDLVPRVELYRCRVGSDLEIQDVVFAGTGQPGLIAMDAKIEGELKWRMVRWPGEACLDLRGAHAATLDDCPQTWSCEGLEVFYEGLTYERIEHLSAEQVKARIEWLNGKRGRQSDDWHAAGYSPQPYNQLAVTLRTSGHEQLATRVAIAREDDRRKRGELTCLGKAWSCVLKHALGSGYQPARALLVSVVLVLVGTVVFCIAKNQGQLKPLVNRPPAFNELAFSLDAFLPISDLQQEKARAPRSGTFARYYLWLHIGLGWVLVTLGLLGVTGLVRRE